MAIAVDIITPEQVDNSIDTVVAVFKIGFSC